MIAPLPIWVLKNGRRVRRTKSDSASVRRGRLAPAPAISSGRLAASSIWVARSSAAGCATGSGTSCGGTSGTSLISSPAMSSGSSSSTGPGRSSIASRKASRTRVGMLEPVTMVRAILVIGRMAAMMSTIWNRAWRLNRMPFWPVSMIIGMAPRCA